MAFSPYCAVQSASADCQNDRSEVSSWTSVHHKSSGYLCSATDLATALTVHGDDTYEPNWPCEVDDDTYVEPNWPSEFVTRKSSGMTTDDTYEPNWPCEVDDDTYVEPNWPSEFVTRKSYAGRKSNDSKMQFQTLWDKPDHLPKHDLTVGREEVEEKVPDLSMYHRLAPPVTLRRADDDMQKTSIPPGLWKGRRVFVEFRHVGLLAKWTMGDGQPMNTDTILRHANTWSDMGGRQIPRFVEARSGRTAQIRVSFNNNQNCKYRGRKKAQYDPAKKPTMYLDLHNGCPNDEYKKHMIIHEFGLALGLGYEHQRSIFWRHVKPFTNIEKMKKDLNVTDEEFAAQWKENDFLEEDPRTIMVYDPDSIMHYRFKVDWLRGNYSDEKKVKRYRDSGDLIEEAAEALLGVHRLHHVIVEKPSALDIQQLRNLYCSAFSSEHSKGTDETIYLGLAAKFARIHLLGPAFQPEQHHTYLTTKDLDKVYNAVSDACIKWLRIGIKLGLEDGDLGLIEITNRGNPEKCLTDVLKIFLRQVDQKPSWEQLADAMASKEVGRRDIAAGIKAKLWQQDLL